MKVNRRIKRATLCIFEKIFICPAKKGDVYLYGEPHNEKALWDMEIHINLNLISKIKLN